MAAITTSAFNKKLDKIYYSCQRELEELRCNLAVCMVDNARMRHLIPYSEMGDEKGNVTHFTLMATKPFISNMETMDVKARELNVILRKKYGDKSYNEYCPSSNCSFKEFFKYNYEQYGKKIDLSSGKESGVTVEQKGLELFKPDKLETLKNMVMKAYDCMPLEKNILKLTAFEKDYEFKGVISYIKDYDKLEFFVCKWGSELLQLSQMLDLPKLESPLSSVSKIFGVSTKNSIFRAVVYEKGDTPSLAKLFLIDFGESVTIDDSFTFYKLPTRYQYIPKQAIKCILVGVGAGSWHNCDDYKCRYVLRENEYKLASFRVVRNTAGLLRVLLLQGPQSDVETNQIEHCTISEETSSSSTTSFCSISDDNCAEISSAPAAAAASPPTTTTIQEKSLCKSLGGPDSTTKSSKVTGNKISTPQYYDWPVTIKVTYIIDIVTFYAQIDYGDDVDFIWEDGAVAESQRLRTPPRLREIVLAKYSADGMWYRGLVLKINHNPLKLKVYFVDYGNSEFLPINCIAKCPTVCAARPYRAVRCRLADIYVDDIDKKTEREAMKVVDLILRNQVLDVNIIERDNIGALLRIIDERYTDFNKRLIESGFVKAFNTKLDEFE